MRGERLKIGIIGANGQVGAEVCLFLDEAGEVDVVPICRTEYGSTVLRRLGLRCWHGDAATSDELNALLSSCDLVADFSLPRGSPEELVSSTETRLKAVIPRINQEAQFVFVSTMAVFHLNPHKPRFSIYGYTKRSAERLACRLGKRHRRAVSVLRLAQVHGVNQSCSKALLSSVCSAPVALPPLPSHTVFTYTVADALIKLARGAEKPGTYTLTSVPPWSWREVHEFYCREAGVAIPEMREERTSAPRRTNIWSRARRWLFERAYRQREFLETLISNLSPNIATRMRALYYLARAREEVGFLSSGNAARPYAQWREVPGRRMTSLSDSRSTMKPTYQRVRERFASIVGSQGEGERAGASSDCGAVLKE